MSDYNDFVIRDHQAWLGYIRPDSDGLVVSPAALSDAQVVVSKTDITVQQRFLQNIQETETDDGTAYKTIADIHALFTEFLEWPAKHLVGFEEAIPEDLIFDLPEYGENLSPSFALFESNPGEVPAKWLLLGLILPREANLDAAQIADKTGWSASYTQRFERLLREKKVPIGLIVQETNVRLLYAPHGESSGYITFPVGPMCEVAGRTILSAFYNLLGKNRLFTGPIRDRLPGILQRSRDYQNTVSTELAKQVLDALYEMLRGMQAADERAHGNLLRTVREAKPNSIYEGLLTVLMRLVFLLYAEDRNVMPSTSLYNQNYSVHDLYERLREDASQYPDTMDGRFGAWARLLALFRAVYNGCGHPDLQMPARHGHLFDSQRFPFLEGNQEASNQVPLIADGVIYRVLEKLLVLKGERLSYRTLDVEQIGSVYETMMGFRLEIASGPAIALKPAKKMGAPTVVDLIDLLDKKPADRSKTLKELTGQKFTGNAEKEIKAAKSPEDLLAAFDKKIARNATPHMISAGAMVLQPTDERRRSGSHYTPRSLTEPIVRKTFEPIFSRLGDKVTPEQILDLKVCDIAMGSGAFLVEACRQLADALVHSWHVHKRLPKNIPPDETEELFARRIIAQRCLYGVDRNPMAVDLAKLSLWLATLAKDHPFTFLDHNFRCGDSLVGLTQEQITDFTWTDEAKTQRQFGQEVIEFRVKKATEYRREILEAGDFMTPQLKRDKLSLADEALDYARRIGDLAIAAFFAEDKAKARKEKRDELLGDLLSVIQENDLTALTRLEKVRKELRTGQFPVTPFHWDIEFPEVFGRENDGFDAIVGNPPFLGGKRISGAYGKNFSEWNCELHPFVNGNTDIVAVFFRQAFQMLHVEGALGLIATNTIGQGDTRRGGLRPIIARGGRIYYARRRARWPGEAAVVVSIICLCRADARIRPLLDEAPVTEISAFLMPNGNSEDPAKLKSNQSIGYMGCDLKGQGFLFADDDQRSIPSARRLQLVAQNSKNQQRIFPYVGGEELMDCTRFDPQRWAIDFRDFDFEQASNWPDLLDLLQERIPIERAKGASQLGDLPFWRFWRPRVELYSQIETMERIYVCAQTAKHLSFTALSPSMVFSNTVVVVASEKWGTFACLQSTVHIFWTKTFAATLKDDQRYMPDDCLKTFPFPPDFETDPTLESAGRIYYEFRADLMIRNNEGLTKTYNRFHDPDETSPDVFRLRELHEAMDRAVLDAYKWQDIPTNCNFILDYEDEEDDDEASSRTRKRKKPWRYRWPDDIRDEVLARLLALNAQRAEEEALAGLQSKETGKKTRKVISSKSPEPFFE